MAQSRLPFPDLQIEPSDKYSEPTVWLRRVVFVESPRPPISIIRRITFRRGLNIICTEPRLPEDTQPVGHSVGKSLMVRIIRYCLGEDRFCTDTQRAAIAQKLERGYVLAVIRVGGEDWAVARPLGLESGYADSWCVRSNRLKTLLDEEQRLRYRQFLDALNAATAKCYADIDLPRAGRRANWRDLLGWLSRDQDCHFDHHADWRAPQLHAGPRALTREDAYLVMRMALGLLGPEEIGLMESHWKLLDMRQQAEDLARRHEAYITEAEDRLRRAVDELQDEPAGEMFAAAFENIADQKVSSLTGLLSDPDVLNRVELRALEDVLNAALRHEGSLEERSRELTARHAATTEELRTAESQDAKTMLQQLAGLRWKCSYFKTKDEAMDAGCPGKNMVDQGIADPWRKQRINELQEEIAAVEREQRDVAEQLVVAQKETATRRQAFSRETANFVRTRDDITRQIGRWTARKEEAQRYADAWRDLGVIEGGREKRQKRIEDSHTALKQARSRFDQQKAAISEFYDSVLKRTISPNAEGRIEIDGDGLRPVSNEVVADSGTTLREYADVLSFDLACLVASVCGTGHLPRFWIHDSPRQADSEEQLYHSVLGLIAELEAAYRPARQPAFQYILTTTSAPPTALNHVPFVRARLHARTEAGKLLRCDFGK